MMIEETVVVVVVVVVVLGEGKDCVLYKLNGDSFCLVERSPASGYFGGASNVPLGHSGFIIHF